jgi:hypothetical protein
MNFVLPILLCIRCARIVVDLNDAESPIRELGCLVTDPDDLNAHMGALCKQCVEHGRRAGKLLVADWRLN